MSNNERGSEVTALLQKPPDTKESVGHNGQINLPHAGGYVDVVGYESGLNTIPQRDALKLVARQINSNPDSENPAHPQPLNLLDDKAEIFHEEMPNVPYVIIGSETLQKLTENSNPSPHSPENESLDSPEQITNWVKALKSYYQFDGLDKLISAVTGHDPSSLDSPDSPISAEDVFTVETLAEKILKDKTVGSQAPEKNELFYLLNEYANRNYPVSIELIEELLTIKLDDESVWELKRKFFELHKKGRGDEIVWAKVEEIPDDVVDIETLMQAAYWVKSLFDNYNFRELPHVIKTVTGLDVRDLEAMQKPIKPDQIYAVQKIAEHAKRNEIPKKLLTRKEALKKLTEYVKRGYSFEMDELVSILESDDSGDDQETHWRLKRALFSVGKRGERFQFSISEPSEVVSDDDYLDLSPDYEPIETTAEIVDWIIALQQYYHSDHLNDLAKTVAGVDPSDLDFHKIQEPIPADDVEVVENLAKNIAIRKNPDAKPPTRVGILNEIFKYTWNGKLLTFDDIKRFDDILLGSGEISHWDAKDLFFKLYKRQRDPDHSLLTYKPEVDHEMLKPLGINTPRELTTWMRELKSRFSLEDNEVNTLIRLVIGQGPANLEPAGEPISALDLLYVENLAGSIKKDKQNNLTPSTKKALLKMLSGYAKDKYQLKIEDVQTILDADISPEMTSGVREMFIELNYREREWPISMAKKLEKETIDEISGKTKRIGDRVWEIDERKDFLTGQINHHLLLGPRADQSEVREFVDKLFQHFLEGKQNMLWEGWIEIKSLIANLHDQADRKSRETLKRLKKKDKELGLK